MHSSGIPTFVISDEPADVERCVFRIGPNGLLHTLVLRAGELYHARGTTATGYSPRWITQNYETATDPVMAVGSTDVPHFACSVQSSSGGREILYIKGAPLEAAQWITRDLGKVINARPRIALQGDTVGVAWERDGGVDLQCRVFTSHLSIPPPVDIASSSVPALRLRFAAAHPEGGFLLIHVDSLAASRFDLISTRVIAGAMASQECVYHARGRIDHVDCTSDSGGRLHLVWDESIGGESVVWYTSGRESGGFNPVSRVSPEGISATAPGVAMWGEETVCVSWQDMTNQRVCLSRDAGGGFALTDLLIGADQQPDQRTVERPLWTVSEDEDDYLVPAYMAPITGSGIVNVQVGWKRMETNNAVAFDVPEPVVASGAVSLVWRTLTLDAVTLFRITRTAADAPDASAHEVGTVFVPGGQACPGQEFRITDRPEPGTRQTYTIDALGQAGAVLCSRTVEVIVPAPAQVDLAAFPNPFNASVCLTLTAPAAGRMRAEIRDVLGRVVRSYSIAVTPGARSLTWDGRDGSGVQEGSGVYLVRCVFTGESGGEAVSRVVRVTLVR